VSDQLHVFLFERFGARGALVQLSDTWQAIRRLRAYPDVLERLLGESVVASALLASTLKRSTGSLLIQFQGQGPIRLLVAECASDFALRCTARWQGALSPSSLGALFGNGHCAITVGSGDGRALYQGIVPLESATLTAALERYMERSEQLETRLWLFAGAEHAGGMLLQRVPQSSDADDEDFNRAVHFGATVHAEEIYALSAPALLRRLFPEDDVRLFSGRPLRFRCSCTRDRVQNMLVMLGRGEVEQIIAQEGQVEVTCEFCNQPYRFAPDECRSWFAAAS
jgi:molecular chaperone Hsp33